MKKLFVLALLLLTAAQVYALSPYLYANTSWGALGGGLGFDLGDGKALDLCATGGSGPSGSTYSFYVDYFIGCWGAGITVKKAAVNADPAYDLSILYALEQAINDKVTVGASFTMINYDTTANADPNWTLLPTIGAYLKLPL